MAASFGSTINGSLENALRTGAARADAATGAASQGVGAAQEGLARALGIGDEIRGELGSADSLASQAAKIVNGADADIEAMRSLVPQIGTQVEGITGSADVLSRLADALTQKSGDVAAYAPTVAGLGSDLLSRVGIFDDLGGKVTETAEGLKPHSTALADLAEHLFGHGHEMLGRSGKVLDQAQGLLDLDENSSPMAAEFVNLLRAVHPDTMAARAGADAQSASDSAYKQLLRGISRSGGSLTSGNALSLERSHKAALATLKASAMTRGRNLGYDKQESYLKDVAALANTLLGTGTSMFNSGIEAESQSASARKAAADVEAQMGSLFTNAAQIFGMGNDAITGAGSLYTKAADIEKGAADVLGMAASAESASAGARAQAISGINTQAGIYKDAVSAQLGQASALNETARTWQNSAAMLNSYLSNLNNANSQVVGAYGTLANAFLQAADYYAKAGSIEVSANNGGGGGDWSSSPSKSTTTSEEPAATGTWVDLTHGKASHADGAVWAWDPNAPAAPAGE